MTKKELAHIAPTLARLQNKSTGFKVPIAYFDTVETSVFNLLSKKSISAKPTYILPESYLMSKKRTYTSKIDDTIPETDLSVPDSYFESVEDKVFARLKKEKRNKKFNIKRYWIPVAIAASFLVVFAIYNPFSFKNNKEYAEVASWIEDGNLDLDSYQIAEYFNPDIETLDLEDNFNSETLEDYIQNEFSEETFYN